ncbi:uncharacterized protein J7T54_006001 [Emericellopsis cladophorae]|uniref:L-lactate dehydrogenase (cytochrome) n=1 Tax=Emericellopsis cladophorae TaxID=2686198 RepID=A0A9P9Y8W2_9HYPO|nr:uncharacterized protein J7T54_006001 [Emericellopsis cladophorae]KAI6785667.1 hypothetical protein J7T54_006001 [Emericellopsis cladophorae]
MEATQLIPAQTVLQHGTPHDCWIVIDDEVWDVTKFAPQHPGGASVIVKYAGRDATEAYSEIHTRSIVREHLSPDFFKGNLDRSTITEAWTRAQDKPESPKAQAPGETEKKIPLHNIISLYDFAESVARTGSTKAYAFYSTAATDCCTRDANEQMIKRIWFRPRVMKNVAQVDTSTSVMGIPMKMPLFICPTGLAKLIHPDGEKGLARAAESTGILEIVSSASSHPLRDVVAEAPGYPFFFQLYLNKDKSKSAAALRHAQELGIRAVFLTVDAAGRGKRESDERLKVDEVIVNPITGERAPVDQKKRGGLTQMMGSYIDQGMTWKDIAWIRSVTDLPIVLKGITTAADARLAVEHGVEGIMLSNHGGRNLDFAPPSILLLLEMHRNCPEVFDKVEVYVDGGYRRGGDIIKALCLGAKAVGLGRSFLYSMHYGTEGAEHLVELLKEEMESVMKLLGIKDLSEVHPGLVNTSDVDHLVVAGDEHPYAKWRPKARM